MDLVHHLAEEMRKEMVPEREDSSLEALLPQAEEAPVSENPPGNQVSLVFVPRHRIVPNPRQPRKHFDPQALQELADSIRSVGLLQPLAVRALSNGTYELISGERRLRACGLAEMETVPVVVFDADDKEQHVMALVENIQRQNLSPVEEAVALDELLKHTGENQSALAARLGRSQASVANKIRLLRLEPEVQEMIQQGQLGERQARALVGLPREAQLQIAGETLEERLPARDVESRARSAKKGPRKETKKTASGTPLSGPEGPTGDLLQELVALVDRRKKEGLPVELQVRDLQQSQLVVELRVNLGDWEPPREEEPEMLPELPGETSFENEESEEALTE